MARLAEKAEAMYWPKNGGTMRGSRVPRKWKSR